MPTLSPRLRDAAVVLPLAGLFLLMPPVITLFTGGYDLAGVPLIVAYLFGVWVALIACTALLARRIARGERDADAVGKTGEEQGGAE